ncbi:hypothetical protein MKK50_15405 [Methylobacterium sp. J-043]|jgi:hypothetical protein|uniref:Uncharacterized protein n=1 Tax=Methylobacterium goesingense TaxID=243690 RepID=A0ABV2LB74_9HYPH|nr:MULTISPECIES: hypothetical protein [Methylobacteriaceae]KQQ13871.1 hypothetical protein ASF59_20545 [Methylobacterium sp. Leaf121]MCJ2030760.1 hypothetical protein [Methylobacterium sp. J-043]USU31445.1 hypothetical protein NG677_19255 [Methylobacterium sp. OTU13CASTA1]UYW33761.1 hypothetical protein OKB92_06685 [Methylorubrum extorquens]GJD72709.1 hypothetical protein CFIICLFH_0929 [Methylobacterium goesingense]
MAKREPRLSVSVTEGARDADTGRTAFRMVIVQASGEAGINAALKLVDAVTGVLDRPKPKVIGRG